LRSPHTNPHESDSPPKRRKCEGSSSFLKKRTKKLLFVSGSTNAPWLIYVSEATDKSFLVLFFKKELLP
jgi:hypothetical protein